MTTPMRTRADPPTIHLVVPDWIDDPRRPSGGSVYDREVARALTEDGAAVRMHRVSVLSSCLARVPDGAAVVVDGLLADDDPESLRAQRHRLTLLLLVHLPRALDAPPGDRRVRAREATSLEAAAAVVTTSAWARRWILDAYPLDPDRVRVARPGVTPAPIAHRTPAGRRLLFVGAVVPAKGPDVLVDALAGLADRDWDCRLVGPLHGDPAFVEQLRRRIAGSGSADRIRLVGPLAPREIGAEYATADLLVLPTRLEMYGMALPEALARGIPVLSTGVGGVAEAVGHDGRGAVPGVLVPAGDAGALRKALRRWLTNAEHRARLRACARGRRSTLPAWSDTADDLRAALFSARLNRSAPASVERA